MNEIGMYAGLLLNGLKVTLIISFFSTILGLFLGSLLLINSLKNNTKSKIIRFFIDMLRGLPLLVLILTAYLILKPIISSLNIVEDEKILAAIIIIGVWASVYFSEILRGAYNFINKKQILIANSLGISKFKLYKDIIIPQLLKKGKNPLIKQSIICFNESSLVYIIGINDFFGVAVKIGEQNQSIGTSLLLVSIVYITISLIYQKLILKNKY